MQISELDNLVKTRLLKQESGAQAEFDALRRSGEERLTDAGNRSLTLASRFDLAYNGAHALSLAALRWHGYRPDNQRFIVFQCLAHTIDLPNEQWRVLDGAHRKRNQAEYEGVVDVDDTLVDAMLRVTREIAIRLKNLGPMQAT